MKISDSIRTPRNDRENVHGGSCGRLPSLNTLPNNTPTPSNTPNKIPQATAELNAVLGPPTNKHVKYQSLKDMTRLTSSSQATSSHKARYNRIPHVFLLTNPFNSTIKGGEHPSPNAEVASRNWSSCFDDRYSAN